MHDPNDMDNLALASKLERFMRGHITAGLVAITAVRLRTLDALVKAQTERIGAQSELLSKAAEEKMLTVLQVADLLVVSERTIWRLVERGEMPQPLRINRKLVRWKASAIAKWMEDLET